MEFLIVANKQQATLARQLAHTLSQQPDHAATYWTVKQYKDNESQLGGKQPIVFLGGNDVANSYVGVLSERFRTHSVSCHIGGSKVVITADQPTIVSRKALSDLKEAIRAGQEQIKHRLATANSALAVVGSVGLGAASSLADIIWVFNPYVWLFDLFVNGQMRKQEYRKLQYEYAVERFLLEEFDAFVAGIEIIG